VKRPPRPGKDGQIIFSNRSVPCQGDFLDQCARDSFLQKSRLCGSHLGRRTEAGPANGLVLCHEDMLARDPQSGQIQPKGRGRVASEFMSGPTHYLAGGLGRSSSGKQVYRPRPDWSSCSILNAAPKVDRASRPVQGLLHCMRTWPSCWPFSWAR